VYLRNTTVVEKVIVANSKGPIPEERKGGLTNVTPHILRVPTKVHVFERFEDTYGTTLIEESLPRTTDGSPFVISLPTKLNLALNTETLVPEIQSLGCTVIFGIDMGGDSISGGIDHPGDASLGRDMQFKVICDATGIPFYHIVAGPCCDGETQFQEMEDKLTQSLKKGLLLGCFGLDCMKEVFATFAAPLEPGRTPNIVLRAMRNSLDVVQQDPLFVKVPRNLNPIVPHKWLVNAWVLKYNQKKGSVLRCDNRNCFL